MSQYLTDAQAKAAILDIGKRMYDRRYVAANDGNISVKTGDNRVWVTPTGVSKGFMTEDMLVCLDLDGNRLEGTGKASSETKMHLRMPHTAPVPAAPQADAAAFPSPGTSRPSPTPAREKHRQTSLADKGTASN